MLCWPSSASSAKAFEKAVNYWVAGPDLRQDRHWGRDAPLFPPTRVSLGVERRFDAVGGVQLRPSAPFSTMRSGEPISPISTPTASDTPSSG